LGTLGQPKTAHPIAVTSDLVHRWFGFDIFQEFFFTSMVYFKTICSPAQCQRFTAQLLLAKPLASLVQTILPKRIFLLLLNRTVINLFDGQKPRC
jgi:hypothetical protein